MRLVPSVASIETKYIPFDNKFVSIEFSGFASNFFEKTNFPVKSNTSILVAKFEALLLILKEPLAGFG